MAKCNVSCLNSSQEDMVSPDRGAERYQGEPEWGLTRVGQAQEGRLRESCVEGPAVREKLERRRSEQVEVGIPSRLICLDFRLWIQRF